MTLKNLCSTFPEDLVEKLEISIYDYKCSDTLLISNYELVWPLNNATDKDIWDTFSSFKVMTCYPQGQGIMCIQLDIPNRIRLFFDLWNSLKVECKVKGE